MAGHEMTTDKVAAALASKRRGLSSPRPQLALEARHFQFPFETSMNEHTTVRAPIDKEALKAKYAAERDKRIRPDGNAQYQELKGQFGRYAVDPYTPFKERAPKTDHVTFAFVGGGFAGLVTGARVAEAGVKGVRIIEKGGDFGGTWYWNRYPGAQ